MSTISDWTDDFGGADLNTPQDATAIPFPANGTTDLGFILRDTKAVIRQESRNKGWEPDARTVTPVDNTSFRVPGELIATIPEGTALRVVGDTTLQSFVDIMSVANGATRVFVASGTVPANAASAYFSPFLPGSTAINVDDGYTDGIGSAFPLRISQWGRFIVSGNTTSVTVYLSRLEPNASYRLLLQSVDVDSGPANNNAYTASEITKNTSSFAVTFNDAPGTGVTLYWDFAVVRGT